jgi:hypothetical protein
MDIFIDESGTHKKTGHATSAVVTIQVKNIEKFEKHMVKILEELDITVFHWAEHGWKIKEKFFKAIMELEFTCMAAVFQNPYNPEKMVEIVFQHLITDTSIRSIYIDGEKPKWYGRKLKKVLRDKGVSVKKLRAVRNEMSHPGIQLADAVAGLIRYCYDNPQKIDSNRLFKKLKKEKKLLGQFLFESQT